MVQTFPALYSNSLMLMYVSVIVRDHNSQLLSYIKKVLMYRTISTVASRIY